jgi:hypothetical protein
VRLTTSIAILSLVYKTGLCSYRLSAIRLGCIVYDRGLDALNFSMKHTILLRYSLPVILIKSYMNIRCADLKDDWCIVKL